MLEGLGGMFEGLAVGCERIEWSANGKEADECIFA